MNIIVMVKQVPDTTEMNVDKETGTLIRKGVPSIINPDDLAGVEEALKLKEQYNGKVTAITMGPSQADDMLRELLARGVDDVILVTDRKFAGADTWATSNTLGAAISQIDYDLIIAGRQAIDGDTAQVGPQTAEKLEIPQVTYVSKIIKMENNVLTVEKTLEDSTELIDVNLPCLITTLQGMNNPRYMTCSGIWDSFEKEIKTVTCEELDLDSDEIGLNGSPTKVKKTFTKEISTETTKYTVSAKEASSIILSTLKEKEVLT